MLIGMVIKQLNIAKKNKYLLHLQYHKVKKFKKIWKNKVKVLRLFKKSLLIIAQLTGQNLKFALLLFT